MDLVCTRCGEPWHVDYVLHEEPEDFERKGGLIYRCPTCPKGKPKLSPERREELAAVREVGELLGSDVDGFAAMLEDFNLL